MKTENERLTHDRAVSISDHRAEIFRLKSQTFQLTREKANLGSQIEGLENVIREMKTAAENIQNAKQLSSEEVPKPSTTASPCETQTTSGVYEAKAQLRGAHDEIFRLKNEVTKLNVKLRESDTQTSQEAMKYKALQETSVDYSNQLQASQVSKN